MKKKRISSLLLLSTSILPISLLSCSQNEIINKTKNDGVEKIDKTSSESNNQQTKDLSSEEKFWKNILTNVNDDGLFLIDDFYGGNVYDANKQFTYGKEKYSKSVSGVERIPVTGGWGRDQNVIQMKSGDSIFMLYDKDDNDGLTQENFEETVTFNDSSIIASDKIYEINSNKWSVAKIDNGSWSMYDLKFIKNADGKSGHLSNYLGSQSNHVDKTWDEAMQVLKTKLSNESYKAIEKYYETASKGFIPILFEKSQFLYERINNRVVKITYNGDKPITAARFRISNYTNDSVTRNYYGTYSLNEKDFSSYENSQSGIKYFFLGKYEKNN